MRDGTSELPQPHLPTDDEERGRGRRLVQLLADSWCAESVEDEHDDGKAVWFATSAEGCQEDHGGMTAYVLADIDVTDPARYEEYKALAGPSVEQYGGRYAVRGGTVQVLEGDWPTGRFVVLEFPDADTARRWYSSAEYSEARSVRQEAATARLLLVEP